MRSLIRKRPAQCDPAPSRLAYKIERLRLTPGFRRFVRTGVPIAIVCGFIGLFLSDDRAMEHVTNGIDEIRRTIEERPEFAVHLMAIDGASRELAGDIREVLPYDFPISSFDLDLEQMRLTVADLDPEGLLDPDRARARRCDRSAQETMDSWRGTSRCEMRRTEDEG